MTGGPIVIVGAGISGATIAERYAAAGRRVIVLEKRPHIGGNCFDFVNETGIRMSLYGAHLFHTSDEEVWEYVQRFAVFEPYEHRVLAAVEGALVPVPVNITTVNILFDLHLKNTAEMQAWLRTQQVPCAKPRNSREAALARVGPALYDKIFKHYTFKQWAKYPEELDPSVLNRIPVRTDFDDRYFTDTYQALPRDGYAALFARMLDHPNISVYLDTDYFDYTHDVKGYDTLFYTGPIDRFFDGRLKRPKPLEYRSINFVPETHAVPYYQPNAVINYPNDYRFTRIVEYKHLSRQRGPLTTIVKEFTTDGGEPYYPVPNPENRETYEAYRLAAAKLRRVYFVGRLANYKYFNMDEAFKNALTVFRTLNPTVAAKKVDGVEPLTV